jgi:anti-sigma-K factor RskA
MTCREREDDLHLYALDALEDGERAELERHLRSGCPRCLGMLAEARATAAALAHTVAPVQPSPAVKERVMAEIRPKPARKPAHWAWPALAAAAAAAATFLLVAAPAQRARQRAQADLARVEARARELEVEYDRAARTLRVLRAPGLEMAALAGQGPSPGARGRLLLDPASGEWQLLVAQLPPSKPGKTYEAWLITADGTKLPAGTFDVDPSGEAELVLRPPAGVTVAAVAITDEPAGGVAQPTGQIHLVGTPRS